jgi:hypothetical protein
VVVVVVVLVVVVVVVVTAVLAPCAHILHQRPSEEEKVLEQGG